MKSLDDVKRILGECISHGYTDHALGLREPTKECEEFFDKKLVEMSSLFSQELSIVEKAWQEKMDKVIKKNPAY